MALELQHGIESPSRYTLGALENLSEHPEGSRDPQLLRPIARVVRACVQPILLRSAIVSTTQDQQTDI